MIKTLLEKLRSLLDQKPQFHAFVGCDGFIDKIQHLVQNKTGQHTTYYESITEFASHLGSLAGKSGQMELVRQDTKLGGNAPILANALASAGVQTTCMGTMGYPQTEPVFRQMHPNCEIMSVGVPAETNAFEFEDGKLMFSELTTFEKLNWTYLENIAGLETIRTAVARSQVVALVDWVNLPQATNIWEGMLEHIVNPAGKTSQHFLFDLCDPSKKSASEIREVLQLISHFSEYVHVTFGLNENEAQKVWLALHDLSLDTAEHVHILPDLKTIAGYIFSRMQVQTLLIHPTLSCIACTAEGITELPGRWVRNPVILTGGGDNLNAGYCLGLLAGMTLPECLLLGMATSGAYIQNGHSPAITELIDYLTVWEAEQVPS